MLLVCGRWEMANFHVALWNALEQVYIVRPSSSSSYTANPVAFKC